MFGTVVPPVEVEVPEPPVLEPVPVYPLPVYPVPEEPLWPGVVCVVVWVPLRAPELGPSGVTEMLGCRRRTPAHRSPPRER